MRKLLADGLKLGESLARLPWEAARRVTDGRSETLKQAADLGERLGTLPFRAAQSVLGTQEVGRLGAAGPGGTPGGRPGAGGAAGDRRPRTVVLGAGYAGLTCFLELQDHLSRNDDLTLVNGDKYHWFTTELHTYVAGEPEDAVRIPLARVVARPGRLTVGRVTKVDPAARTVELEGGRRVAYDMLVFALGSDPEYYGLPGVAENSLIVGNWQGATRVRERIGQLFRKEGEAETVPHVVVAGGGLTGVEVAGELADEYGRRVRLTILEAGPDIMGGFAPELVRTSRDVLMGKGIEIRTGNPIARVQPGKITFKDGGELSFDLLVWAGGVRGSALLAEAGFATTPKGRGKVDAYLRAEGHPEVYLVGDSAAFTDPATGRELPPTAQAAVQMGRTVGRNILRQLKGQASEPFMPKIKGSFASLGRAEGVGQIGAEQYTGVPAMLIKELVDAHHAWETGGGILPLVSRLVRAPGRYLRGRPAGVRAGVAGRPGAKPAAGLVAPARAAERTDRRG
ncbi:MAG TPA: NAD(P)/FAD-dependent oxidoreductase [Symbiobacteriaceae bacterium]|jgi:NADH dehydrogenase